MTEDSDDAPLGQAEHSSHAARPEGKRRSKTKNKPGEREPGDGRKQADILLDISKKAVLFVTPQGDAYADVEVNSHRETWPVRSSGFKGFLTREFYMGVGGAPSNDSMQTAVATIEAQARYSGCNKRDVNIRVASQRGAVYIDLCSDDWAAIEVSADGWEVIARPPVRFRRSKGMLPLPVPASGGSIDELRRFMNVKSDSDFVLIVSWLLAALTQSREYPILMLSGEQGTAKSTLSEIMRSLVDPNTTALRSIPRDERDLVISASNGHVLAFDNLSGLPSATSDALCRLSTGSGFATRALYTDGDEVLFEGSRPTILNGISDVGSRGDLLDRSILVGLEPIPENARRSREAIMRDFNAARPGILGALLDGIVEGLRRRDDLRPTRLPRMAGFALWSMACETAFWPGGTFSAAYSANQGSAVEVAIESNLVATAVTSMMSKRPEWSGTAKQLLALLGQEAGKSETQSKGWPHDHKALGHALKRAAPALRKIGIEVAERRVGKQGTRAIFIQETRGKSLSALSACQPANDFNGLVADNDFPADNDLREADNDFGNPCPPQHIDIAGYSGEADNADNADKDLRGFSCGRDAPIPDPWGDEPPHPEGVPSAGWEGEI